MTKKKDKKQFWTCDGTHWFSVLKPLKTVPNFKDSKSCHEEN